MNKIKLLKLINEDDEIRDAILNILNQKNDTSYTNNINDIEKKENEILMLKDLVKKWKKCFNDEEIKRETIAQELSKQKISLNEDILKLQKEKNDLLDINNNLESNLEKLNSDNKMIESSNNKLNKTIEFYRDNFSDEVRAYELFSSLSSYTKSSIGGIFKDFTLKGFISCGVQDKNISSFWEYIKIELQEDKNSDIESLIEIYNFLFQNYLIAYPIYQVQEVIKGDEFDPSLHIKYSRSKAVSGSISKVILKGYINTKTSKVIKQSLVKVG